MSNYSKENYYNITLPVNGGKRVCFLLYRNEEEKLVAQKRMREEHFLQRPPAIAYDTATIEKLEGLDVEILEAVCEDKIYSCPLQRFLQYAKKLNRGYGEQLYLCFYLWDTKLVNNELPKEGGKKRLVQSNLFS